MPKINYMGITRESSICHPLTDDEYNEIIDYFYKKPDVKDVERQLVDISNGSNQMDFIYQNFLKDLMAKCKTSSSAWSIEDALRHKPIVEYLIGKAYSSPKAYDVGVKPLGYIFERTLLTAGIRYCTRLPNFPLKTVRYVLSKYCKKGGNYYDFSCGWASRMLGSISSEINYYGTEPNFELVNRLNTIKDMYDSLVNDALFGDNVVCDIKTTGSETHNTSWESKMDLAFSSPPYFNLEDYKIGNQSYKSGTTYDQWVESYLLPTVKNIYSYLKTGGYFIINVRNPNGFEYDMEKSWRDAAKINGFAFVGIEDRQQDNSYHRCHIKDDKTGRSQEPMFVFQKQ